MNQKLINSYKKRLILAKFKKSISKSELKDDISDILEEDISESSRNDEEFDTDDDDDDEVPIIVGICAMAKKVNSKPMEEILNRFKSYAHFKVIVFEQDMIVNKPVEEWPKCDCLVSFYSKDFPLSKAEEYARLYKPFLINDLAKQWDIMDRIKVYELLKEAGIEQPRYVIKRNNDNVNVIEQDDQIEINGEVFTKPFVEKPLNSDDHNVYVYFPPSVGGGSQRLFRKVGSLCSLYSSENKIRCNGSFIYEEFIPTDGFDVKVYTVGNENILLFYLFKI
jgi:inositol hexakisphosphate/diphosphoinositol-pentakisphosphate kinase